MQNVEVDPFGFGFGDSGKNGNGKTDKDFLNGTLIQQRVPCTLHPKTKDSTQWHPECRRNGNGKWLVGWILMQMYPYKMYPPLWWIFVEKITKSHRFLRVFRRKTGESIWIVGEDGLIKVEQVSVNIPSGSVLLKETAERFMSAEQQPCMSVCVFVHVLCVLEWIMNVAE